MSSSSVIPDISFCKYVEGISKLFFEDIKES